MSKKMSRRVIEACKEAKCKVERLFHAAFIAYHGNRTKLGRMISHAVSQFRRKGYVHQLVVNFINSGNHRYLHQRPRVATA